MTGGGGVWFPAGTYSTSILRVPSYVGLFGHHTWSYHDFGGTELVLRDELKKQIAPILKPPLARMIEETFDVVVTNG